jgi:3-hydroxyisobutyrate dehydrogenase
MAGSIATKSDHDLRVYNRTAAKAQDWVAQYGHQSVSSPIEAADGADFIFSCVGNDNDLREVTLGPNGAFQTLKPGALVVDHTTSSAEIARELETEARERGASFMDAPVSGGQKGAEDGVLTVMAGGNQEDFEAAKPIIDHYSRALRLMGPVGSGQLTKMVNQIAIGGLVQALSESIHFAECAGLDVAEVMQVITKGAAQSWQMENRWETMSKREFKHGFAVDWMRKDLNICLSEARRNGAQLPVTALVDQFYADIQQAGGNRYDTSSLITRLHGDKKPT